MNWKKRAQFSGPAIGDIDDILGNMHQDDMDKQDAEHPATTRGYRPSEFSVPTVQTEPEYLLTKKRDLNFLVNFSLPFSSSFFLN